MRRMYKPPDQWNRHNDCAQALYVHNAQTITKSNRERKNRQVARARQSCKEVTHCTRKKMDKIAEASKEERPTKTNQKI